MSCTALIHTHTYARLCTRTPREGKESQQPLPAAYASSGRGIEPIHRRPIHGVTLAPRPSPCAYSCRTSSSGAGPLRLCCRQPAQHAKHGQPSICTTLRLLRDCPPLYLATRNLQPQTAISKSSRVSIGSRQHATASSHPLPGTQRPLHMHHIRYNDHVTMTCRNQLIVSKPGNWPQPQHPASLWPSALGH